MTDIKAFDGDYRFLSNFYPCKIEYEGLIYSSVEAAFQAAKCHDPADRQVFTGYNPSDAKKAGRRVCLRTDWEKIKTDVLYELLQIKFRDNPELQEHLLATGDAELVEGNHWHDNFYGDCQCDRCKTIVGRNMLGTLLMKLRDDYRCAKSALPTGGTFMGVVLDFSKLMSSEELLQYLKDNGPTDRTLADIRERYEAVFGADLIWRYPLSDGMHLGTMIIPVQEGFLSLPFDDVDSEDYEIFIPDDALMMDVDSFEFFQEDLRLYTEQFCNAMQDAIKIVK